MSEAIDKPTREDLERMIEAFTEHMNVEITLFLVEARLDPAELPSLAELKARLQRVLEAT